MKIVMPLSNVDFYEPLAEAGADEFFAGIVPFNWLDRYTNMMPFNRREALFHTANFNCMSSLKILRKMVEAYKVPIKIALNSHYYVEEQYPLVGEVIKELMDLGFDTFIIADLALLIYLREVGIDCNIHLSGEMELASSLAIDFMSQFNISRIVFPRKITLDGIGQCISKSASNGMEYEAFMLNGFCMYSGGFCHGIHCDEFPSVCSIPYKIKPIKDKTEKFMKIERMVSITERVKLNKNSILSNNPTSNNGKIDSFEIADTFGSEGCGVCRIRTLMDMGVTHIKIVGRGYSLDVLKNDVGNIKQCINMALEESNSKTFEAVIKDKYFKNGCPNACYYP